MTIGEKIRRLRKLNNWTQSMLAHKTGGAITQGQISEYENGTQTPKVDKLSLLAEIFNIPITALNNKSISLTEIENIVDFRSNFEQEDKKIMFEIYSSLPLLIREDLKAAGLRYLDEKRVARGRKVVEVKKGEEDQEVKNFINCFPDKNPYNGFTYFIKAYDNKYINLISQDVEELSDSEKCDILKYINEIKDKKKACEPKAGGGTKTA